MTKAESVVIGAEPQSSLLHAVLAALPVLRSDRQATVAACCVKYEDGSPDLTTLDAWAKPYVAEYDRLIALCELGLQKAGLR